MCAVARNGRACWQAKRGLNSHYTVWSRACCRCTIGLLAASRGFEPRLPDSESGVLPLDEPAILVGVTGFEPVISPVRGADVAQATPHAEKENAAAPVGRLALGSSGVTLDRHSPPRSGAGAFQARQGRADDAERHRFQISPMLRLEITPIHQIKLPRNENQWSGRDDLNVQPPRPKRGALPGCATPRYEIQKAYCCRVTWR